MTKTAYDASGSRAAYEADVAYWEHCKQSPPNDPSGLFVIERLEQLRDELIDAGASDAEKLESLRALNRQLRRTPELRDSRVSGIWTRPGSTGDFEL